MRVRHLFSTFYPLYVRASVRPLVSSFVCSFTLSASNVVGGKLSEFRGAIKIRTLYTDAQLLNGDEKTLIRRDNVTSVPHGCGYGGLGSWRQDRRLNSVQVVRQESKQMGGLRAKCERAAASQPASQQSNLQGRSGKQILSG